MDLFTATAVLGFHNFPSGMILFSLRMEIAKTFYFDQNWTPDCNTRETEIGCIRLMPLMIPCF